jgi:phosphoribosyl 1,2-cyclic phosphodiesterase
VRGDTHVRIRFWGTRGSIPVPEAARTRGWGTLGGNTPCVEIRAPGSDPIILDAGMGLHWVGRSLLQERFGSGQGSVHLLLTHTHWGHIQGIPFFPPLLVAGNQVSFYGRGTEDHDLASLLRRQMDSVYCPVPNAMSDAVGATTEVHELTRERWSLGPVRILQRQLNHAPGCVCLGYRLDCAGRSLAYLPDVEYLEPAHRQPALELAQGVDLLIHDAHFLAAEYEAHRSPGHCSDAEALSLAREAGVRQLLLFHHHPDRVDGAGYVQAAPGSRQEPAVEPACEGTEYVLTAVGVKRTRD